ncbi:MAG: DUF2075 domain-containing protein [Clostridia bacterium]|nr:DUF2075 domain-containing protein [Clostridia bacterium]
MGSILCQVLVFPLKWANPTTITQYLARDAEQAEDYALDLKNFHKESENLYVCPILIATEADAYNNTVGAYSDKQVFLQKANKDTMMSCITDVYNKYGSDEEIDFNAWYNSQYCPTPTIIEAAVEAYINNTVEDIAHSEAGQADIDACEEEVSKIVEYAKNNNKKCICFITGVPGAGKTLVGLDLASKNLSVENNTKAVYLSGNGPLVAVLRKALVENSIKRKNSKEKIDKKAARTAVQAFIQAAYQFRKDNLLHPDNEPPENVLIFDEAQRCWDKNQLTKFVKNKMGKDIDMSEPECFIEIMNRRKDWAVIICLVGLGQDIYDGEVGINEWFRSAIEDFDDWELYYSEKIFEQIEDNAIDRDLITNSPKAHIVKELHLSTGIRSFRSQRQSELIDNLLAGNSEIAKEIYNDIFDKYPIYVTRDIKKAKDYTRKKVRGSQRCGIVACSSAQRLKPDGLFVPTNIDVENWFLAPKEDLRSSNAMEVVASEFKVQGLEIDYSIVCWDADLRRTSKGWDYYNFRGTKWQHRNQPIQQRYLINAYRVLLTRARQSMIIFVPEGDDVEIDPTRDRKFYDSIYNYLHIDCGIREL